MGTSLTDEELEPALEDLGYAKELIDGGWKSISNRYRLVSRLKVQVTGADLIRPEMQDTYAGKFLMELWDQRKDWALRGNNPDVERLEHVGRFLEWLQEQGIILARYHEHSAACTGATFCDTPTSWPMRYDESFEKMFARYAKIDLDKVEKEKRALLEHQRELNQEKKDG